MSSLTDKPQPDSKKKPSQAEIIAMMEKGMATLHGRNVQLERTLWLAAKNQEGSLVIDEEKINLLWTLEFERLENGTLKIIAGQLDEALPEDLKECADALIGTNGLLNVYTQAHDRLKMYPPSYLEFAIAPYIRFDGEKWVDTASLIKQEPPPTAQT